MNPRESIPPEPIEELVRQHLDREAAKVDPQTVLGNVRRRQAHQQASPASWSRLLLRMSLGLTLAASLLLMLFWVLEPNQAYASAERIVKEARTALTEQPDRHYVVESHWEPWLRDQLPLITRPRKARLWTRGDRLRLESIDPNGRPWAWGKDGANNYWFTPNRKLVLSFTEAEVPESMAIVSDFCGLDLDTMLDDLLAHWQLTRQEVPDKPELVRIQAQRRFRRWARLRSVTLDIDPDTRVIHRVVLERNLGRQRAGRSTFTLLETAQQPDDFYTFFSILDGKPYVLDGTSSGLRGLLLRLYFGRARRG